MSEDKPGIDELIGYLDEDGTPCEMYEYYGDKMIQRFYTDIAKVALKKDLPAESDYFSLAHDIKVRNFTRMKKWLHEPCIYHAGFFSDIKCENRLEKKRLEDQETPILPVLAAGLAVIAVIGVIVGIGFGIYALIAWIF